MQCSALNGLSPPTVRRCGTSQCTIGKMGSMTLASQVGRIALSPRGVKSAGTKTATRRLDICVMSYLLERRPQLLRIEHEPPLITRHAFAFSRVLTAKMRGFGLAVAVLDATLIRMVLVPAVMHIAGRWNWARRASRAGAVSRLTGAGREIRSRRAHRAPTRSNLPNRSPSD